MPVRCNSAQPIMASRANALRPAPICVQSHLRASVCICGENSRLPSEGRRLRVSQQLVSSVQVSDTTRAAARVRMSSGQRAGRRASRSRLTPY